MVQGIEERPYKLINKIQYYDWGTKNKNAYIPKLLNQKVEKDKPYAELWIGAHPKASSEIIDGNEPITLDKLINKYPYDILGKRVAEKFKYSLPFLLKVLSIDKPLSIQSHPNKKFATRLFKTDPFNYYDTNHKPEIAICIDKLDLVVGIINSKDLKQTLHKYSEIEIILGRRLYNDLLNINSNNIRIIKKLFKEILYASNSNLEKCILALVERIKSLKNKSDFEKHLLKAFNIYGIDPGLIFLLLLNFKQLRKDEAIFTPAGIPHAYIGGNIIECMANSDNVVRAGLTNKYKDVKTLVNILEIDNNQSKVKVIRKLNRITYKTSAKEFEVSSISLDSMNPHTIISNNSVTIILVLTGNLKIQWKIEHNIFSQNLKKGDSVLIPNKLNSVTLIRKSNSKIYCVTVP